MKIARVKTEDRQSPSRRAARRLAGQPQATRPIVILEMATDDGVEGLGVSYFGGPMTGALRTTIDELGALTIGEDPSRPERIAMKLRDALGTPVLGGLFTLAQSAIDIALWDMRAKALGLPLWKLLAARAIACRLMPAAP
ncbi:MAG: hypothetical protein WDO24_28650 [Pseudomonadota bacterium]